MQVALTREVSTGLAQCQLTHLAREPIDVERARAQHARYEVALAKLGAQVQRLPGPPELPDCVFIEDTAIVLPELAFMLRPGAASRQLEVAAVAQALQSYRPLRCMQPPGLMDGGDVLRIGNRLFVGRSSRTNDEGIRQLRTALEPLGYTVDALDVRGCLHLKSAATEVAPGGEQGGVLLINPGWITPGVFGNVEVVEVDGREAYAANALRIGDTVIYPEHFPWTAERLERRGIPLERVPCDELAKAEGAVTCCSLLFDLPIAPSLNDR
jgi:dimethylargininase